jgi:hypothetical protein
MKSCRPGLIANASTAAQQDCGAQCAKAPNTSVTEQAVLQLRR